MNGVKVDIEVPARCIVSGCSVALWHGEFAKLEQAVDAFAGCISGAVAEAVGKRPVQTSRFLRLRSGALATVVRVKSDVPSGEIERALARVEERRQKRSGLDVRECDPNEGPFPIGGGRQTPIGGAPAAPADSVDDSVAGHATETVQADIDTQPTATEATELDKTAAGRTQTRPEEAERGDDRVVAGPSEMHQIGYVAATLGAAREPRATLTLTSPPTSTEAFVAEIEPVYLLTLADGSTVVAPASAFSSVPAVGAELSHFLDLQALRQDTLVLQEVQKAPP